MNGRSQTSRHPEADVHRCAQLLGVEVGFDGRPALEALVDVLRQQWQRVLRLLLRALLVVLEGSLEKSLAS